MFNIVIPLENLNLKRLCLIIIFPIKRVLIAFFINYYDTTSVFGNRYKKIKVTLSVPNLIIKYNFLKAGPAHNWVN